MKNRFMLCMAVAIKIVLLRAFCLFKLFALPLLVLIGVVSTLIAEPLLWLADTILNKALKCGLIHDWPDALKGLLGFGRLPRK